MAKYWLIFEWEHVHCTRMLDQCVSHKIKKRNKDVKTISERRQNIETDSNFKLIFISNLFSNLQIETWDIFNIFYFKAHQWFTIFFEWKIGYFNFLLMHIQGFLMCFQKELYLEMGIVFLNERTVWERTKFFMKKGLKLFEWFWSFMNNLARFFTERTFFSNTLFEK